MLEPVPLALIALLLLLWLWVRRRKSGSTARPAKLRQKYHSVEIQYLGQGCKAVQALQGQVFLSQRAPKLPLPECTSARCRCRYRHLDDRRRTDRRGEFGDMYGRLKLVSHSERRHKGDRRYPKH